MLEPGKNYIVKFKAPFDTNKYNNTVLTFTSMRTFKEFYTEDINIFKMLYETNGLTIDNYTNDVSNGVLIYTFISNKDEYIYVPSNYVDFTDSNKHIISYTPRMISFNLGLLPDDLNIEPLCNDILGTIKEYLELEPAYQIVRYGESVLVTSEEDKDIRNNILPKFRNAMSWKNKYERLLEQNTLRDEHLKLAELALDHNITNNESI